MTSIIITICILLLLAYIFDISAAKTKIPSVVLLLILGFFVREITVFFEISIPDLTTILPLLGTVGLILIVLEGSLELELNKTKFPLVKKTMLLALIPMFIFSMVLAYLFHYFGDVTFKIGLANAIPFAIISSSIAIPSAQNLATEEKEFITYESSLSDIFGVIFFNFITLNDNIGTQTLGFFIVEILAILVITFIATLGLAYLLSKIKHHIKFAPIILMVILIYAISKVYHLPGLIFILLFGLFLGNLDEIQHNKYIEKLNPSTLIKEVYKFKDLNIEMTFLIRALFFLLFGYLIEANELLNPDTVIWAIGICAGIFILRYIFLRILKVRIIPLALIAPRGLITILLFFSIPIYQTSYLVNKSLIIQVILLTALVMMIGLLSIKTKPEIKPEIMPEIMPEIKPEINIE